MVDVYQYAILTLYKYIGLQSVVQTQHVHRIVNNVWDLQKVSVINVEILTFMKTINVYRIVPKGIISNLLFLRNACLVIFHVSSAKLENALNVH